MNSSNFKNETLHHYHAPEMGEMAQTFMSEIEWLAALKCQHDCSLRNKGIQQICQIDVGPFLRCKVYNI